MPNARAILLVVWTFLWSLVGIFTVLLDPTGRLYLFLARKGWAPQILWLAGLDVTVRGAERVDWSRPYVVVANHSSQLDIPLLFAKLPTGIRFLAKRSLFWIPFFGWSLGLAQFIPVDRRDSQKARRSIARAAERIKKGPSLVVFPEGTRTPDGEIQAFKSGAFIMAIRAQTPVLPVAIRGTYRAASKHTLSVTPGPVDLIIGDPLSTEGLGIRDKDSLLRAARERVVSMHRSGVPEGGAVPRT